MNTLEILFFVLLFIVFYTYVGYGILLWILVKIKQSFLFFYDTDEPEMCIRDRADEMHQDVFIITDSQKERPPVFPISPRIRHIAIGIDFDRQYHHNQMCIRDRLRTRPHHGQRVNNRSGIHPQLYPESNQETQVTVLGRQGGYQ